MRGRRFYGEEHWELRDWELRDWGLRDWER
jgi:hypothetical protein